MPGTTISGVRNIVVVESAELGSGSSAEPLGGMRAGFSDPATVEPVRRSPEAFRRFPRQIGTDTGFQQTSCPVSSAPPGSPDTGSCRAPRWGSW